MSLLLPCRGVPLGVHFAPIRYDHFWSLSRSHGFLLTEHPAGDVEKGSHNADPIDWTHSPIARFYERKRRDRRLVAWPEPQTRR